MYKINFYANTKDCSNYLIKSITIKTPKFNEYANLEECKNNDSELCEEFYDTKKLSKKEFLEKLREYNENKNKTNTQRFYDFIKN